MLEQIKEIAWEDYFEVLNYGNPPVYIQLLILVGLSIAIWIYRVVSGKRPLSKGIKLRNKLLFVMVFVLILFQEQYDLRSMLDTIGL